MILKNPAVNVWKYTIFIPLITASWQSNPFKKESFQMPFTSLEWTKHKAAREENHHRVYQPLTRATSSLGSFYLPFFFFSHSFEPTSLRCSIVSPCYNCIQLYVVSVSLKCITYLFYCLGSQAVILSRLLFTHVSSPLCCLLKGSFTFCFLLIDGCKAGEIKNKN